MGLELLAVDNAGNDHRQTIEQQFRGRLPRQFDADGLFVRGAHQLVDIFRVVTNALEVGGRRLIHLQKAAERIDHICRGNGIARGKVGGAKMKRDALVICLPALCQLRRNLSRAIDRDQPIVKIGHDFVGFRFGSLMGV
ncbi:hypothetical protein D3C80_1520700 [compost metagenome]